MKQPRECGVSGVIGAPAVVEAFHDAAISKARPTATSKDAGAFAT